MRPVATIEGEDYRPSSEVNVPSGGKARFGANLAAIEVLRRLEGESRPATADEQQVLAGWSGWGAIPDAFSGENGWGDEARQLREALTGEEYRAARATTLNAHYTDPSVVTAMWSALDGVGATGDATILEPGSGSGNFMGRAPEGVQMIGVELDPLTARLSHYLYPSAQVRNEGFEQTVVREGMVDAAIGNVPYGSFTLHDPLHNGAQLAIHNHFIVKSLDAVRPGGLVAVVTSGWTMDSQGMRARIELAKRGDLVAGVRLPTDAFSRVAGTKVNTDILVFQKRPEPVAVPDFEKLGWGRVVAHRDSDEVVVNEFFARHPERVAGAQAIRTGRFGPVLEVDGEHGPALGAQVQRLLTEQLQMAGVVVPERDTPLSLREGEASPGLYERLPEHLQPDVGKIVDAAAIQGLEVDSPFVAWDGTDWTEVRVRRGSVEETRSLLDVRDKVALVLRMQSSATSTPGDRQQSRARLNVAYDDYVGTYGPINRFTLNERRPNAASIEQHVQGAEKEWRRALPDWMDRSEREEASPSEELRGDWEQEAIEDLTVIQKKQPHLSALRSDPGLGSVLGLEVFDEDTQVARKSRIFEQDIISGRVEERHAQTVDEAIAISMDEAQRVEIPRVAALLGIDDDTARDRLAGAAFEDPATGDLVPAALYLSGPVRDKLEAAEEAAATDERFSSNVTALRDVQPEWIAIEQIDLVPGVNVLDAADYARFARETFNVEAKLEKVMDTWKISHPPASAFSTEAAFRFGTRDRKPTQLLEAVMNQKPVQIRYRDEEGKMVLDRPQTAAAREKCDQITAAFQRWVHADEGLRTRVETQWNRTFNQLVEADFSTLGASLELPGLSAAFTPHPHQREGVARMLNSPATLLNHVVGAGKTGTMVMGAMELRRTGRSRKPWMVVPNHIVDQVTREASQWYPSAKILSVPTGLSPLGRQTWMARSAGQDWDIVIVPQSTFKLMGVAPALAHEWVENEVAELRASKADLAGADGSRFAIKALEGQIKTLENRAKKLLESKDVGMTFEQTGCDHLIVDEAHLYKNLSRSSDVTDLNHVGSQIASDLDMKIHVLRDHRIEVAKRDGTWREGMVPHVVDFATGTPVANNMAELWVMQRYLRPDVLEAQGIDSLREWARAFARTGQGLEIAGDGVTWRVKDRVRSFANLPELMSTSRVFMSTVTKDDVARVVSGGLPELVGGARQVHTRSASEQVKEYGQALKERAETRDPTNKDNMLKIIKDGQLVALDPRMRGMDADEDGGRIAQVADVVAEIHARTSGNVYLAADGVQEPLTGGLQLIFLDNGVPGGAVIDLYEILRQDLEQRGVDPGQVAFIHDADSDDARARLFERCRDGRTRVLIGSTQQMGTGVNVQRRAVALHHVDVPWRPDQLEQREGRLIRQGNANGEVEIHTYITTGTVDVMSWQTIERKSAFIAQVTSGTSTERTVEQDDESMEKMARTLAALAADSPLVMERVEVLNEIMRLQSLETVHRTEFGAARGRLRTMERNISISEQGLPRLENTLAAVQPAAGVEAVDGSQPETATELAEAVRRTLRSAGPAIDAGENPLVVRVQGIDFVGARQGTGWRVHARDAYEVGFDMEPSQDVLAKTNIGVRLTNQLEKLPERIQEERRRIAEWNTTAEEIRAFVETDEGFPDADALRSAELRLSEIDTELGMTSDEELSERVFGSQIRGKVPLPATARDLRVGDEFRIRGRKEQYTLVRDDRTELYMVAEGGEEEEFLRPYEKVELASRLRSSFNAWEQACVDLGERDALVAPRDLQDGTAVLVAVELAGELVPAEAVVEKTGAREGQMVRVVDPAAANARVVPRGVVIVRDRWTPQQVEARRAAETMLPVGALYEGQIITAAVDEAYTAHPEMAGAVLVDSTMRQAMLEGQLVSVRGWRVQAEDPIRVSGNELAAVGVDGPIAVDRLREGDRVRIKEIDRDAKTDRVVTVVSPADAYTRSAETGYVTDDGTVQTGKIKSDAVVNVEDRAISALTPPERVRLAQHQGTPIDGVSIIPAGELSEHVGATVIVRSQGVPVAGVLRQEARSIPGRSETWRSTTVELGDKSRGLRVGTEDLVKVDGEVGPVLAQFDLTGGHEASRMSQDVPAADKTISNTPRSTVTPPPVNGPDQRRSGPGVR
ncbi:lactate dehydrogenase [Brachybacterium horti]